MSETVNKAQAQTKQPRKIYPGMPRRDGAQAAQNGATKPAASK